MDRALSGRVRIIQESKDPASSLPAYKSRIVGAVSGGSATGAQMRPFLKWPGMVPIQVKLGMVGVCAMVPGPWGGDMGIPQCVPVSLWAVPVTTVWLSVVSGPDSQLGFIGLP